MHNQRHYKKLSTNTDRLNKKVNRWNQDKSKEDVRAHPLCLFFSTQVSTTY